MQCDKIRKKIDLMVYRDIPGPDDEIFRHIESCRACSRYLEETRLAAGRIAGIRCREPLLRDPEELTESIMQAIRLSSESGDRPKKDKIRNSRPVIVIQRLLAAASVCLCLVFGYEQYLVVDKISRLEKQNETIARSSDYRAALNLKTIISLLDANPDLRKNYKDIQRKKLNLRTLAWLAMYIEFDSTLNTPQQ